MLTSYSVYWLNPISYYLVPCYHWRLVYHLFNSFLAFLFFCHVSFLILYSLCNFVRYAYRCLYFLILSTPATLKLLRNKSISMAQILTYYPGQFSIFRSHMWSLVLLLCDTFLSLCFWWYFWNKEHRLSILLDPSFIDFFTYVLLLEKILPRSV